MKHWKKLCTLAALTGLTACGGGGGGDAPLNLATVQGVWDTTTYSGTGLGGSTLGVRGVMLPDGAAWLFLLDGAPSSNPAPVGLVKSTVSVAGQRFSGAGTRFMLDNSAPASLAVAGSVPATSTLALDFAPQAGATATATAQLAPVTRFNELATKVDMNGAWSFSSTVATGGGSTVVTWNWSIDGNGTLSGSNTLGCSFTGQVIPRSEAVKVYNVSLTESCNDVTGTVVRQFSGVALQNSAKTLTTFGLVVGDNSYGTVVVATKGNPPT